VCGDGPALRSVAPKNKIFLKVAMNHVLLKEKKKGGF
jgi:hypothetical protein